MDPPQDEGEEHGMVDNEIDELGPVDYLVGEFPAGKSSFAGENRMA